MDIFGSVMLRSLHLNAVDALGVPKAIRGDPEPIVSVVLVQEELTQ